MGPAVSLFMLLAVTVVSSVALAAPRAEIVSSPTSDHDRGLPLRHVSLVGESASDGHNVSLEERGHKMPGISIDFATCPPDQRLSLNRAIYEMGLMALAANNALTPRFTRPGNPAAYFFGTGDLRPVQATFDNVRQYVTGIDGVNLIRISCNDEVQRCPTFSPHDPRSTGYVLGSPSDTIVVCPRLFSHHTFRLPPCSGGRILPYSPFIGLGAVSIGELLMHKLLQAKTDGVISDHVYGTKQCHELLESDFAIVYPMVNAGSYARLAGWASDLGFAMNLPGRRTCGELFDPEGEAAYHASFETERAAFPAAFAGMLPKPLGS